ncbi:MAG: LTA synthase family protein [Coriobacteriia bacterium]|nr:LTA synthase family protein [Coriobacteriia bacterium]
MAAGPLDARREAVTAVRAFFLRYDVFLVTLIVFAMVKVRYARLLATGSRDLGSTLLLETAAILVVLGVVDLLRRRRPYFLDLAAYSVLSVSMVANSIYAQMFGRPLDPRMFVFAGQVGDVQDSVFGFIRTTHIAMVADVPFLLAWAIVVVFANRRTPPQPRKRLMQGVAVAVAAVILAGQVASVLALPADSDPLAIIKTRGFGPEQIASLIRFPFTTTVTTAPVSSALTTATVDPAFQARIESIRGAKQGQRIAQFAPGAYKGRDVIVIQVEGLLRIAVGAKVAGQEITPNLNRLVEESWYFPNTYSQTSGGNTSDAEFSQNSGLLPPLADAASLVYADKRIPALPRLLRAEGYDAITMHANYATFWNRDQLYPALGFRRYYDHAYFLDRDRLWHASDQILFTYGMKAIDDSRATGKPLYAHIVTMTSHIPYLHPPADRRPLKVPAAQAGSYIGRYVGSISYADLAIGEFIAAMKKNGLYDDAIIVVYGDHTGLPESGMTAQDRALMQEMIGRWTNISDRQRIPLVIHLPGQTAGIVSREALGQVDIMPTIADALGLDLSGVPHVGKSAFVASPGLVPMRSYVPAGTFANDRVVFVSGLAADEGTAFLLEDGSPTSVSPTEFADRERSRELSALSDQWARSLPRRPDAVRTEEKGW